MTASGEKRLEVVMGGDSDRGRSEEVRGDVGGRRRAACVRVEFCSRGRVGRPLAAVGSTG